MSVTAQLLRVFQVDKQIRSLQSRLKTAEAFLGRQVKDLDEIDSGRKTLETQVKQQTAAAADQEGEAKRIEAKMASLRDQMNNSQTNKQYQAFLIELNTLKIEKDRVEAGALETMSKSEETRKKLTELDEKRTEREQVRVVAARDRDERFNEISGRLSELKAEFESCIADVPKDTMVMFNRLIETRGDEAMGPIEIVDRKRHEYNCGTCMMAVPMESVNALLTDGRLTRCSACQCVMYLTREDEERLRGGGKKER
jgi:predicted  nucleic acid-binding Zn-ribbon protein